MQSPKFKFLKSDLGDVFADTLLKEEWKKRVRYQIRKQLIFDAIEYRDFNDELSDLVQRLRTEVLSGSYSVKPTKRYLVEKSRGLCRQMTLVHPRDLLVLERLSRTVHYELKQKAPSKSAFFEPDEGNFTSKVQQAEFEYGSFASWKKFQKEVFGFADENLYIIATDVANFYDFINFQHLRNIIASLAPIREAILDLLIYVLNRMTWTPDFMPLSQTGMPQIETSATRVLANAMLYEVDKVCEDAAIENYARFMDDMDIGVNSVPDAKCIVRDIDLTLQSRQLRLNSSKTKIFDQAQAFEHFCIAENFQLARLAVAAKKKRYAKVAAKVLKRKYERWLQRGPGGTPGENSVFRRGNGSKIHKYILRLVYDAGGSVPDEDLLWLIRNDPGMRSTAFRYLPQSKKNNRIAGELLSYVLRGTFVDDASLVELCGYFLHARFRRTSKLTKIARHVSEELEKRSDIGLICSIFIAAKFLFRAETLRLLRKNKGRIRGDFWLARTAAGISPKFFQTEHFSHYLDVVRSYENEDAERVLGYLLEVSSADHFPQQLRTYLETPNHSFPQKIYFPKVLQMIAAQKNPNISSLLPTLSSLHKSAFSDPHYKSMGLA